MSHESLSNRPVCHLFSSSSKQFLSWLAFCEQIKLIWQSETWRNLSCFASLGYSEKTPSKSLPHPHPCRPSLFKTWHPEITFPQGLGANMLELPSWAD
jgi:hypothetical protein